jgi:T-complex protein 1 subunit theta
MGYVDVVEVTEIGGDRVTVVRQLDESEGGNGKGEKSKTATIVLRGATTNRLDDLERAVDDGVSVLKALLKDARLVPGAGATELALAKRVDTYGSSLKGLSQHAVKRYASALEVVPRTLAENALGGTEGNEVISRLWAKHEEKGGEVWGVDVEVRITRSVIKLSREVTSCLSFLGREGRNAQRTRSGNSRLSRCKIMGAPTSNRSRRVCAFCRQHYRRQTRRRTESSSASE